MKVNLKSLAVSALSFLIVAGLMKGSVQEFIHFADPINELATAALLGMTGIVSLGMSFETKSSK
jgi:hypothetical protein